MDLDHASTAVFAHWPGDARPWYHDLRRMGEYSPVLGRFASVDGYFRDTQYVGQSSRHKADQYQSPYLRQEVAAGEPDPISRWVRYYRQRAALDAANTIRTMADLISGQALNTVQNNDLAPQIDHAAADGAIAAADLDDRLARRESEAVERFSQSLPRTAESHRDGILAVNPWSFTRRVCLDVSQLEQLPSIGGPVWAANETGGKKFAIVDLPPMGFAWLGGGTETLPSDGANQPDPSKKARLRKKKKEALPLAEENVLRNDFFEVQLDPITGAIRSLDDYTTRGNRLAQQIAFRLPPSETPEDDWEGDESESRYTIMAADEVSVISAGPIIGRTVVRGRLMDRSGARVARFRETLSVRRGSRILELQIDLDMERLPGPNPWDSYYAVRFAWGDATADLLRSVNSVAVPTEVSRLEAPYFVDVRSPKIQTTILTGGLPYHRRFGLRKLDSLLAVKGDSARSFRLGIGVDLKYPMSAALAYLAPQFAHPEKAPPPIVASGWLFHLDSRNVIATAWEPLMSENRLIGFRVRLLETEGRSCKVGLRSFRSLASARKVDFLGQQPEELDLSGDRLGLQIAAHEWVQVEAEFSG
jgi:alpha-mannosidase